MAALCGQAAPARATLRGDAEDRTSAAMERARAAGPLALRAFLADMPKGGDLHNHLAGAVYAETWLRDAAADHVCVDAQALSFAHASTGALAVEAARRGAQVVAIDRSPTLVGIARERLPAELAGRVDFHAGDMLDPALGRFDYVVCMDSVIHYEAADAVRVLVGLAQRTERAMLFTFVPGTPALLAMRRIGRLFPKGDRAPSVVPVAPADLLQRLDTEPLLEQFCAARTQRVSSGFYKSHAVELARS